MKFFVLFILKSQTKVPEKQSVPFYVSFTGVQF